MKESVARLIDMVIYAQGFPLKNEDEINFLQGEVSVLIIVMTPIISVIYTPLYLEI